jgi:Spy/CpxP family protein refolding chaperone
MTTNRWIVLIALGALLASAPALASLRGAGAAAPATSPNSTAVAPPPGQLAENMSGGDDEEMYAADELLADADAGLARGDVARAPAAGPWAGRDFMRPGRPRAGLGGPMRAGRMGMLGPMARRLDLTDSQRERLRDIRDRQERRGIQARADLQIARMDLRRLMSAERPDHAAIDAQIDRNARLRAELAKARVASMLEARAVLSPEQQRKLRELREDRFGPSPDGRSRPDVGRDDSKFDSQ